MVKSLRIGKIAPLIGILVLFGFVVDVATNLKAISELKVGGPIYERIVLGKDLIADILPPPEYIIEPYLEATLALNEPNSLKARQERLTQLRKDYDTRHDYWQDATLNYPREVLDKLTKDAHAPAMKFWQILNESFLPALTKGDEPSARQAYEKMTEAYTAHRAVIDAIVETSTKLNADIETDAKSRENQFMSIVWTVSIAVFLVIGAVLFGVLKGVVGPIGRMTESMMTLANGDTGVTIPSLARGDEVGDMARTVEVFKSNLIKVGQMQAEQERLKKQAEEEKKRTLAEMADTFEKSVLGIVSAVSGSSTELHSAAQSLSAMAEQTNKQSEAVAHAADEASSNVQTVASAAEELSSSIQEITQQVGSSARVSASAVDEAAKVNAKVQGLAGAVGKISEVVNLINDIASQTNLLALNATIEAARAGEAGKGFAVVANEVKNLANQTAKATEEITSQINAVQNATQEAVQGIEGITTTINHISEIAAAIAQSVEEQGAATTEISRSVQQASMGTSEVSSNIAGVTHAATETGSAASQVLSSAGELSKQSEHLREDVGRFIGHLRAG
jgi:methyl-accepting chemotaxis protein